MRQEIDDIEIKDPPIQEFNKKKSCLARGCLTGCGCLFLSIGIIVISTIFLFKGPKIKELKNPPENFPSDIPIYDKDSVEKISFTPGTDRNKLIERLAIIPKITISPIYLIKSKAPDPKERLAEAWQKASVFIKKPVINPMDIIKIEWSDLPASPKFIFDYYKTELEKAGYQINISVNEERVKQFSFTKKNNETLNAALYIKDIPETQATDYAALTLEIPNNNLNE